MSNTNMIGIIWSIFFQRLFGPITPNLNEFFDIPYPFASDQNDLDTLIDQKINELIKRDFENIDEVKLSSIMIQFYDPKTAKSRKSSWFGQKDNTEHLKSWESWIIKIKCLPMNVTSLSSTTSDLTTAIGTGTNTITSSETGINDKKIQDQNILTSIESFEENLNDIIDIVDNNKDHIPPITSLDSSPFPYEIKNIIGYNTEESWGKYIKRILD